MLFGEFGMIDLEKKSTEKEQEAKMNMMDFPWNRKNEANRGKIKLCTTKMRCARRKKRFCVHFSADFYNLWFSSKKHFCKHRIIISHVVSPFVMTDVTMSRTLSLHRKSIASPLIPYNANDT